MAFASTTVMKASHAFKISAGTFTNASTNSGGDIETNIHRIAFAGIQVSSHLGTEFPKISWSGSTLTIVTSLDCDGYWWAFGR
jgi:hypothetical protein